MTTTTLLTACVAAADAPRRPARNSYELASSFNADDGRFGVDVGGNDIGETEFAAWYNPFHDELDSRGVAHRYRSGDGTRSWAYWPEPITGLLEYVSGTTPTSCPNEWEEPA